MGLRIGFNFVPFPQEIWDEGIDLSRNGFLLLGYLLRHTLGWRNTAIAISNEELISGRKKSDGTRYDRGCGINSKRGIIDAREELLTLGWITANREGTDPGREKYTYSILLDSDNNRPKDIGEVRKEHPRGDKNNTPQVTKMNPLGYENNTPRGDKNEPLSCNSDIYKKDTKEKDTKEKKEDSSANAMMVKEETLQPSQAQVAPIISEAISTTPVKAKPKKESQPKQEKESSLHQRLMAHRHQRIGPSPSAKAEAPAVAWLVKQVEAGIYSEQDCYNCMEYQLTAPEEKWRTQVSWNTVVQAIGTWKQRQLAAPINTPTQTQRRETNVERNLANLEIAKQRWQAKQLAKQNEGKN